MNDITQVEMMDFDEISEWLSDRMQEVDREDFRAIVTMAVMIAVTQEFFEENPDCYVRLLDFWESQGNEQIH